MRRLVMAIVTLAHNLNLEVIAEGIETKSNTNSCACSGVTRDRGFCWDGLRPRS